MITRWIPVVLWWLSWSAAGVAAIAAPDRDRVLTFSSAHGPGVLDLLGTLALLIGALGPWVYLWRGRAALRPSDAALPSWLVGTAGLGAGLILASVVRDFDGWWMVGAGLLTLAQVAAFVRIARRPSRT
jgi:hypothetical protein